ncbi:hypothetical protein [Brevibacillus humidisoli]|nr:hypothetical protein [Brevibacillus humidisoli]
MVYLRKAALLWEEISATQRYPFSIPSIRSLREIDFVSNVWF